MPKQGHGFGVRKWVGVGLSVLLLSGAIGPRTVSAGHERAKGSNEHVTLQRSHGAALLRHGVWLGTRLDFPNAYLDTEGFAVLPGIVVGYKWGRFVLAAGLDLSYGNDHRGEDPHYHWVVQHLFASVGPLVEYFAVVHGAVEVHVTWAMQFRYTWEKRKTVDWDTTEEIPVENTFGMDVRAGVGGRYFFSGRLGLGAEVGIVLTYAHRKTLEDNNHVSQIVSVGPFARLSVAVVW